MKIDEHINEHEKKVKHSNVLSYMANAHLSDSVKRAFKHKPYQNDYGKLKNDENRKEGAENGEID